MKAQGAQFPVLKWTKYLLQVKDVRSGGTPATSAFLDPFKQACVAACRVPNHQRSELLCIVEVPPNSLSTDVIDRSWNVSAAT